MAAAAVLAREAKQQEALALVANAKGRNGTLLRAQLALNAGDTAQVCDFASPIPCQCLVRSQILGMPASLFGLQDEAPVNELKYAGADITGFIHVSCSRVPQLISACSQQGLLMQQKQY